LLKNEILVKQYFGREMEIVAKKENLGKTSILVKIEISVNDWNLDQKLKFFLKNKYFGQIRHFGKKSTFCLKIAILVKI